MVDPAPRAELLLRQDVTESQSAELIAHFEARGFPVRARRALDHRGPEDLGWVVLAALPLQAFLSGLGTEAVADAYRGLKRLVDRFPRNGARNGDGSGRDGRGTGPEPGREPPGVLVLQDSRSELRIVLEQGLPSEAYEQLMELDLTAFRTGPLHYDRALGRWRSELDEAAG
ncbi:hypothetical protein DVA86_33515 [Streptomyces armeniacus]|uniref:Uncharacterized protein n=2 Tax=Streptomyces armeniacus TaxID=83291 RepID=A0A345Y1U2_9ACTN|nr:hypothetical protein DVA86_33515 [Streptomyces armeniacus]